MIVKIRNKGIYPKYDREFQSFLERNDNKTIELSWEEYSEKGGHGYDKFYFAHIVPLGIDFFIDAYGEEYNKEECHHIFKLSFNSGIMQHPKTKEQMKYAKEYSKLSNRKKEAYITEVRNFLLDKTGIYIETPWERPNV